ncbi:MULTISPECIES: hypothetical protein [unclassified Pseudomonas]|nr:MULTISPECIES: hypothetical protein [unclassified Pseudomonas]MCO7519351.1 hypothetical protein [Pseudomonas sp. 1]MCO7540264.1 hypothetical protein [Pseudomonas sp. VA159-2]
MAFDASPRPTLTLALTVAALIDLAAFGRQVIQVSLAASRVGRNMV